jgi:hypothetical protein
MTPLSSAKRRRGTGRGGDLGVQSPSLRLSPRSCLAGQQFSLWPKSRENSWFQSPSFEVALRWPWGGLGVALLFRKSGGFDSLS